MTIVNIYILFYHLGEMEEDVSQEYYVLPKSRVYLSATASDSSTRISNFLSWSDIDQVHAIIVKFVSAK